MRSNAFRSVCTDVCGLLAPCAPTPYSVAFGKNQQEHERRRSKREYYCTRAKLEGVVKEAFFVESFCPQASAEQRGPRVSLELAKGTFRDVLK
jgi:hypothetical protein